MKNILLTFLIAQVSLPFSCFSQNLDSLWKVHNNLHLTDTTRLLANEVLLRHYQNTYKIDTAVWLSEQQVELALSSKDTSWIAYSFFNHGFTQIMKDNHQEAIKSYKKALTLYSIRKKGNYANALNNIAFGYYKIAKYDSAKYFYNLALDYFEKKSDKENIGRSLNQLALINQEEGNIMLALDYYFKALKVFESTNNQKGISVSYINIAGCYEDLGDIDMSKEYYERAYFIKIKLKDELGIAICQSNLSNYFETERKFDTAISLLKNSLEVYKKYKNTSNLAITYSSLGTIYLTMRKFDTAEEYYKLGIETAKEAGYKYGLARFLGAYGKLHIRKQNNKEAIKLCSEGLEVSLSTGQLDGQRFNCECLSAAYENTKDFEKALHFHKKSILLRDSISNEENKKEAVRKIMNFNFTKAKLKDSLEFAQKNALSAMKINEQQAQLEKDRVQKYALYSGMLLLFVLGLVSYKSYTNKKKDNDIISKQKEIVEQQKILVEEKQKEILDSIHYARRIQMAQIPSEKRVLAHLNKTTSRH
ncbi:MAG: tetratricopeptide repeat protein [Sphingobacteriaceae bacterium]|nr:tetratricopeptide repeat protein [Sphingobacteriaceae bacterium]